MDVLSGKGRLIDCGSLGDTVLWIFLVFSLHVAHNTSSLPIPSQHIQDSCHEFDNVLENTHDGRILNFHPVLSWLGNPGIFSNHEKFPFVLYPSPLSWLSHGSLWSCIIPMWTTFLFSEWSIWLTEGLWTSVHKFRGHCGTDFLQPCLLWVSHGWQEFLSVIYSQLWLIGWDSVHSHSPCHSTSHHHSFHSIVDLDSTVFSHGDKVLLGRDFCGCISHDKGRRDRHSVAFSEQYRPF